MRMNYRKIGICLGLIIILGFTEKFLSRSIIRMMAMPRVQCI